MYALFSMTRKALYCAAASIFLSLPCPGAMADWTGGSVAEEQAREKEELRQMKGELGDIMSTINGATDQLNELGSQVSAQKNMKEFHLFAREADWATTPQKSTHTLTYNGKIPGPIIRVTEGEMVRIVLHNQLKTSTSILFHGLMAPHSVNGLPRKNAGIVEPGQSFAYQFVASQSGTYWYHPQIIHQDQKQLGMYGVLIVAPPPRAKLFDKDITLIFSEIARRRKAGSPASAKPGAAPAAAYDAVAVSKKLTPGDVEVAYLINGRSAPSVKPIDLRKGERVRLRLINAGQESVPLHITGHRLKIIAINGSDRLEPHVVRDTLTLNPSDRVDAEFIADNPGVWSLGSELAHQSTNDGKFPGGMACIVRYSALKTSP